MRTKLKLLEDEYLVNVLLLLIDASDFLKVE